MAAPRSPNYPQMDLGAALEAVRPAYKAEGRNKMSRMTLAGHLGYSSLNGRALAKIGAVRAYGLIEGREDDIRIAQDAIIALEAPEGSRERADILGQLAVKPPIFKEINAEYEGFPSEGNLRFFLIKKSYAPDAAGKAAQNYLATMRLVGSLDSGEVESSFDNEEAEPLSVDFDMAAPLRVQETQTRDLQTVVQPSESEREWLRGPLSREVSYRLFVSGDVGPKEIGKLIKLLQAQKDVLDDEDDYGKY